MSFQSILAMDISTLETYVNASFEMSPNATFAEFKDICICRIRPAFKPNYTTQIDVLVHPTNDELTRYSIVQTLLFQLFSDNGIMKRTSVLNAIHERIKNNNAGPLNELLLGLQQIVTLVKHCRMDRPQVTTQVEALPVSSHLHSISFIVDGICTQ